MSPRFLGIGSWSGEIGETGRALPALTERPRQLCLGSGIPGVAGLKAGPGASWGEAGLFYLQLPCVCPHSGLASSRCFASPFHSYPSFALWGPLNMAWAEAGRRRAVVMAWKSPTSLCLLLRPGGTDPPLQGHRVVVRIPHPHLQTEGENTSVGRSGRYADSWWLWSKGKG